MSFKVSVASALSNEVTSITNDGVTVTSAQGVGTTGSPFIDPDRTRSTRLRSLRRRRPTAAAARWTSTTTSTVTNLGYATDSYTMSSSGSLAGFTVSFLDSTCSSSLTTTPSVAPGDSTDVCVRVHVDERHRDDERRHDQGDFGRERLWPARRRR